VFRRAAELSARRKDRGVEAQSVSPEVLDPGHAAIAESLEHDVRRALRPTTTGPPSCSPRRGGSTVLRAEEMRSRNPAETVREHLEDLSASRKQGLKMRRRPRAQYLRTPATCSAIVWRLWTSREPFFPKARSVEPGR